MKAPGDARPVDKRKTLVVLVSIVALFFVGIIVRRMLWH